MDFVSIDVETANTDMASICQIGIAKYSGGNLIDEWSSLIDPEDYFSFFNIHIHGITEDDVTGSPTFPEVVKILREYMGNSICVCHTHFDRVSISRAIDKYNLNKIETTWLDSAMVARRVWTEYATSGYGLATICQKIGYEFEHHDALEDAKAAAHIVLAAIEETKIDLSEWLKVVKQPIGSEGHYGITREGNPNGELFGEVMVFTGSLSIPRREAAEMAASIGCAVAPGVTKKTTLLVVGDQDIDKLAGKSKSSKHLKAEKLISKGQSIRIIKESDFKELVIHTQ